jgi:preprotein translocase subunit SecG
MYGLLLALHLIICLALIGVVLVQSGKGGGLAGGAFGGSAQTVFGGRGASDFFTRATMVLGVAFFITSLTLALMTSSVGRSSRSLIQQEAQRAPATAPQTSPPAGGTPAAPAPSAPAPAPAPSGGGTTP